MKRIYMITLLSIVILTAQVRGGDKNVKDVLYTQSEIQTILSGLSDNLNRFEYLQKLLDDTGKNNKIYDEYKNIWLSTLIAIQAISAICEYENDLLSLLMDLKEQRRVHYIALRIKSFEISIQQIAIMSEQIRINHRLMPPDLAEIHLYEKLSKNINSTINLLKRGKVLIAQLKNK